MRRSPADAVHMIIRKVAGTNRPHGSIDYLGSRFPPSGIKMLEMVTLTFASWNRIREWLRRLDALRRVA
jgi:hypothetical protein